MKYVKLPLIISVGLVVASFSAYKVTAKTNVEISNNGEGARSSVKVQTNTGNNTVCINGECTTNKDTDNGKSTVCVNGKCETSEDGNLNVQSEDGNVKVDISNEGKNSQKTEDKSTEGKETVTDQAKPTDGEKDERAKKEVTIGGVSLEEFIKEKLAFLRDIVTFKFLFGSK